MNLETNAPKSGWAAVFSEWNERHPVLAIVLVSWVAVILNCYPVVFLGRSYVSPLTSGGLTVHSWDPHLDRSGHGSDTAAMMVQNVPWGFVESRSLLQHGELPLWDRYSHAGSPLLGQTVTMLGDPLQLIVIFGHGSALAWDLKFLTAKFLFCAGFGLLVFRLLGSQPLGLIFAALGAYCGAYFYINNHPVFFVFAYAPWILLSALAWLNPQATRAGRWGLIWLVANFGCFNAGHLEVAVILIGGLNLAALVYAVATGRRAVERATVLGRLAAGGLGLLGLTAPVWLSFLAALAEGTTAHEEIRMVQLPCRYFAGAFDDLLYRVHLPNDLYPAPGPATSLLVFVGCGLSALRWRQRRGDAFFWINAGAIVLWGGCIFGWVPAALLVRVPFLNRDGHTDTDFSYLLVLHLTLQSAYGFKALAREGNFRRAVLELLCLVLIFAGLLLANGLGGLERSVPWNYFLCVGAGAVGAPLLFAYWNSRGARISAAGWAAIIVLGLAAQFRFGLYASGDRSLLLVEPRMALEAPGPAIEKIKRDGSGPFRTVGMQYNLSGNYEAVYELEDIRSCAPLTSRRYMELMQAFPGMSFGFEWMIEVADPVAAQPLLNLLNVKYLLAMPGYALPPGPALRVTVQSGQNDFEIVENLEVWPRAFFTDRVIPVNSTGEFIQQLMHNGRRPFAALAPEEIAAQPGLRELATRQPAVVLAATNYQLLANSTAFEVHAPTAGVVCLAEGQARDFTATANGEPKAVLTVNRVFKGIYLGRPGDYQVRFSYRPRHWQLACSWFFVTAAAVLLLAGLHAFRIRWRGQPATKIT